MFLQALSRSSINTTSISNSSFLVVSRSSINYSNSSAQLSSLFSYFLTIYFFLFSYFLIISIVYYSLILSLAFTASKNYSISFFLFWFFSTTAFYNISTYSLTFSWNFWISSSMPFKHFIFSRSWSLMISLSKLAIMSILASVNSFIYFYSSISTFSSLASYIL